jgi:serpin B
MTRSPFATIAHVALATALLTGCGEGADDASGSTPTPAPGAGEARSALARDEAPDVSPDALSALTSGQAAFALDLYGPLGAEGGNVFYSPLSIHQALTMAYAGAAGATAQEMATVLRLGDAPHAAQNALDLSLSAAARAPVDGEGSPLTLEIVNSMWGSPALSWAQPFLDTLAVHYGAGLRLTDFAADPEAAREAINAWVADKTNDRIPDLFAPRAFGEDTALILVNAIFFKASWETAFEPSATADADFRGLDGTTARVPMMRASLSAQAAVGDGWQAVDLPYVGGRASMLLVVPDDLAAFEARLDDGLYAEVTGALAAGSGTVELPRFEFSQGASLRDTLRTLGMPTAFSDSADFSALTTDVSLQISDVVHKAFVKVDEEGTEAAAATAVVFGPTGAPVDLVPFDVRADRPFVFFVRDRETGAILFTGRVVDPRG